MMYLLNLDKQSWETARSYFETDFATAVRSASAAHLMRALSELDLDTPRKIGIIDELGVRIEDMERTSIVPEFLAKMSLSEFTAVKRVVLRYAGEGEAPVETGLRLAALDALGTALQRGLHRSDEEIDVIINGLTGEPIVAQRCAEMVEALRADWPVVETGYRKARFDDRAVPALERNAERLKQDKCASGRLLDALDHIRYGTPMEPDTGYRRLLGEKKELRLPLIGEKLRRRAEVRRGTLTA